MVKRALICTGGTGGHVFPALALAKQLKTEIPGIYIYFAGGGLSKNRFFEKESYPYKDIHCGYFPLKNPFQCVTSFFKIISGVLQSVRLIEELKPDIAIGFGSFHSLPVLLACRLKGIPYVLHAADSIPGKVIRLMSKNALATGIVFPEARKFLKGSVIEVSLPLREEIGKKSLSRLESLSRYGLKEGKKTLLVFGGSQGASFINDILEKAIEKMKDRASKLQVIHLAGMKGDLKSLEHAYRQNGIDASVQPFEDRMDYAWTAADFVVSRAGAGTIAEQIAFEVPGILIPYPHASEGHQLKNADFMCKEVGGALTLTEGELTSEKMALNIDHLFDEDREALLPKMRDAIKRYKDKAPKEDMCSLIKRLIPPKKGEE